MAENSLVEELVSNLIKDKTIKPSERDSVSNIISKAMQNVPNDQIQSFKKRIELLSESSNSFVFSNSGVNVVALQGVVNNIVESVNNTKITSENTNLTQPHQLEALIDAAFEEKEKSNNNFDFNIPEEGTPEWDQGFDDFNNIFPDEDLAFLLDDENDFEEKDVDDYEIDTTAPDEYPPYEPPKKITSRHIPVIKRNLFNSSNQIQKTEAIFKKYLNQGLSIEEARSKTFSDPECPLTEADLKKGGEFHDVLIVYKSEQVKTLAKQDNISPEEVFEKYPDLHPSQDTFFSLFTSSKEQDDMSNMPEFMLKKHFKRFARIFMSKEERATEDYKKTTRELDSITKKINKLTSNENGKFDPDKYYTLLKKQFELENDASTYYSLSPLSKDSLDAKNEILQKTTLQYLTSDKSVSDLYFDIKEKYPEVKISFEDILEKIEENTRSVFSKSEILSLRKSELEIHKTTLEKQAYNLAIEKGQISQEEINKTKTFKNDLHTNKISSLAQKHLFAHLTGLEVQTDISKDGLFTEKTNPIENTKNFILMKKLFNNVIQNQISGLSENDAITKACESCGIDQKDLAENGKYHDSLGIFFAQKIQDTSKKLDIDVKTVFRRTPLLHPDQNLLLKNFLSDKEKALLYHHNAITPHEILKKNLSSMLEEKNNINELNSILEIQKQGGPEEITPADFSKTLFGILEQEKKLSIARTNYYQLENRPQPNDDLIKESVQKYFSGNKSLSDIYRELKKNGNDEIYFEDLAREAKNLATKNGNPNIGKEIYSKEYEIYSNTLKIEAYNLASQKINPIKNPDKISTYNANISYFNNRIQKTQTGLENSKNIIAQSLLKTTPSITEPEMQNQVTEEHTDQEKPLFDPKKLIDTYHLDQDDSEKDLADIKALVEQDKNKVNITQQQTTQNEKSKNEGTEK